MGGGRGYDGAGWGGAGWGARLPPLQQQFILPPALAAALFPQHLASTPTLNPWCRVIGFPMGLILIVFCGGDLFTGNCFYSMSAFLEGVWVGVCGVGVWEAGRRAADR